MARKQKADPNAALEEGKAVFDTLFTAFSVILLAFFILLNSFASLDARRIRVTLGSLIGTFGLAMGGANIDNTGDVFTKSHVPIDTTREDEAATFQNLKDFISQAGLAPFVELVDEDGQRLLRFRESILFPSGGSTLSPKAFPILDRLASVIQTLDRPVRIEGHTDPITTSGRLGNWGLSAARATAVMRFLTEAADVPQELVEAVGRGAGEPLGRATEADDFARSRRVDIYFL